MVSQKAVNWLGEGRLEILQFYAQSGRIENSECKLSVTHVNSYWELTRVRSIRRVQGRSTVYRGVAVEFSLLIAISLRRESQ